MKPQIICHIMTPIDGKVDNSRWTAPDKEYDASEMMAQYHAIGQRLGTDAWILGTNTVKQFFPKDSTHVPATRFFQTNCTRL